MIKDLHLPIALGNRIHSWRFGSQIKKNDIVAGWGYKPSGLLAQRISERFQSKLIRVEEGFFSYLGPKEKYPHRLSYVLDTEGMYYNASVPSSLEKLILNDDWQTDELIERAKHSMSVVRHYGLTKYPTFEKVPDTLTRFTCQFKKTILIIDQVKSDMSVTKGCAGKQDFDKMLADALSDKDTGIIIKTHPDTLSKRKSGYFSEVLKNPRILVFKENCNPYSLFSMIDEVYTVTSQMGFEALIAGKRVTCYGLPFYAGWGLTNDKKAIPRRAKQCCIEELFAAACILYPIYINPLTDQTCDLEDVLNLQIDALKTRERFKGINTIHCFSLSLWKRIFLKHYLAPLGKSVKIHKNEQQALQSFQNQDIIVGWGAKALAIQEEHKDKTIYCIEDGFIRSQGLGSDLKLPASLCLDKSGIYFSYRSSSDLAIFLNNHNFTDFEKTRAKKVLDALVRQKISKYNLSGKKDDFRKIAQSKKIILVPGQVPSDASIQYGSHDICTNLQLLRAVREDNPDCYIIYKVHPDIASGNRVDPDLTEEEAKKITDLYLTDGDILDSIDQADEVHTLTSLTGFEALIRSKKVTCYGSPFYAGYGLTEDKVNLEKRKRKLCLEELVYAALIWYPVYFNWHKYSFCSVESTILSLSDNKHKEGKATPRWLVKLNFLMESLVKNYRL